MRWYECPLWYRHMYRDICVNVYVCPKRTYVSTCFTSICLYIHDVPRKETSLQIKIHVASTPKKQSQRIEPKAWEVMNDEAMLHASAGSEKRQVCHMLAQSTNGYTTLLDAGKKHMFIGYPPNFWCVYWLSSQLMMVTLRYWTFKSVKFQYLAVSHQYLRM